jgi:hypothetical protein
VLPTLAAGVQRDDRGDELLRMLLLLLCRLQGIQRSQRVKEGPRGRSQRLPGKRRAEVDVQRRGRGRGGRRRQEGGGDWRQWTRCREAVGAACDTTVRDEIDEADDGEQEQQQLHRGQHASSQLQRR